MSFFFKSFSDLFFIDFGRLVDFDVGFFGDGVSFFISKSFILSRFLVGFSDKLNSMYVRMLGKSTGFNLEFRDCGRFFSFSMYCGYYELVYSIL